MDKILVKQLKDNKKKASIFDQSTGILFFGLSKSQFFE